MKKLALLFSFSLMFFMATMINVSADEMIDLYPYDQPGCMTEDEPCTRTRVGNSNWTYEYDGHRYFAPRGAVRYVTEFEDENADGFYDSTEITSISWPSFGSTFINDTDESVELLTGSDRTDLLGGVVDRMFAYFNEDGDLVMFEDHLNAYFIHNDGDDTNPEWRFATESEEDAFNDASDPEVDTPNTIEAQIRVALDDDDSKGYVLEPINFLGWTYTEADTSEDDEEDWSLIVDYNPNNIVIPAGWNVVTFGTLDRDNSNEMTTEWIPTLPYTMLEDDVDPFVINYEHQPAEFDGISNLDDDQAADGITKVIDFNGSFDFDPDIISVSWLNMFDEDGKIINATEMLDYDVEIHQNGELQQTITFTYDETDEEYVASEALSAVDTSVFGNAYTATFISEPPLGDVTKEEIDIVVGVVPPFFSGIEDRYINENIYIDLLDGISADDGYGNDISDLIQVTQPENFNPYSPNPGEYTIDLEFTHNVFIEGDPYYVTINGTDYDWNYPDAYNSTTATNNHPDYQVWTDPDIFADVGTAWGTVIIVVDGDGNMSERFSRYTWNYTDEDGTEVLDADAFETWQANIELEDDGFILAAHGGNYAPVLRDANMDYGDPVSYTMGSQDIDEDILVETSYIVTVDDTTDPSILAVDDNYTVEIGQFANINRAIMSNVVAFDNYDSSDDLALYVSDNGGLNLQETGTYTVEVTAEDRAGNASTVTFDITVVEPEVTQDDLDAIRDELQAIINEKADESDVSNLEDSMITSEDVQVMIDDSVEEGTSGTVGVATTVIVSVVAALAAFMGSLVLMIKKPF